MFKYVLFNDFESMLLQKLTEGHDSSFIQWSPQGGFSPHPLHTFQTDIFRILNAFSGVNGFFPWISLKMQHKWKNSCGRRWIHDFKIWFQKIMLPFLDLDCILHQFALVSFFLKFEKLFNSLLGK